VDEVDEGNGEEFDGGNALVGVEEKPAAGAKLEAGGGAPKFEGGAEPAAAEKKGFLHELFPINST